MTVIICHCNTLAAAFMVVVVTAKFMLCIRIWVKPQYPHIPFFMYSFSKDTIELLYDFFPQNRAKHTPSVSFLCRVDAQHNIKLIILHWKNRYYGGLSILRYICLENVE